MSFSVGILPAVASWANLEEMGERNRMRDRGKNGGGGDIFFWRRGGDKRETQGENGRKTEMMEQKQRGVGDKRQTQRKDGGDNAE